MLSAAARVRVPAGLSRRYIQSTGSTAKGMAAQVVEEHEDHEEENDESTEALMAKPHVLTHSEAFVETLAAHGIKDCFGIVGSAFMDALDLFPAGGIRFISTQHEQGSAHMADGYARVSNKVGFCIAQNGPGITNFVTGTAAALAANSPVLTVTPEGATISKVRTCRAVVHCEWPAFRIFCFERWRKENKTSEEGGVAGVECCVAAGWSTLF